MRSIFRATPLLFVFLVPALASAEPRVADSLQPFVDNYTLAGAVVMVADRDKVLTLEAVGWSDVGAKTPMKTDALFWIASMSKPITATGLMMLVDEGKVKLDDPVEKYLPEFKDQRFIAYQDKDVVLLRKPRTPSLSATSCPTPAGCARRRPWRRRRSTCCRCARPSTATR